MNDLQIDYFMAVATNLSFTKTSEELYVSQPAISKQIALMEKELGVKLFSRNNKKIRLTEAGELYFKLFSDFKMEFRNVQHQAAMLQHGNIEELHIGCLEGWDLTGIIPELVERFQETYPRTRLYFDCCGAKEISTLILTGGIEVALTMENSLCDFNEIDTVRVAELQKLLVYSAGSRYAAMESPSVRDFKGETVFAPWGVAEKMITRIIDGYFQPYGFTPEIQFVHNNESMITCVRNGLGIAVTDEWSWAIRSEDLLTIPIDAKDAVCVAMMKNSISEHASFAAEVMAGIVRGGQETEKL
ncbi:MAG: LysR family transcriptional regulator [Mogibacterium sp.]|nr:LysR family transcriptional regulator [Mogibacterium sp.]